MSHHIAGCAFHPQLLSMEEVSNTKTQRVKVTQYDPLYLQSTGKKTGGQQEGEHGRFQHVQGENYQRNGLRVFVIVSGPGGDPESSPVHRRSP